ncbi:hypothetical protein LIER_04128 [Lithospermum erythrorhizon]|uniref:Uncharacterized protein n=1 Tax=Lithospermum erythrorhizon TaxID=34254 RepID=A0AAV3NVS7_LITER
MSSCLSGGGRAYRLDLDLIRSPSTSWTSYSSSPSSTLSESSNSPVTITTRKPRTPRKRPNQTYNEAAAILSTAYPKIFSHKQLTKPGKFTNTFAYEVEDLLLPFQVQALENSGFLIHPPSSEKPNISNESKVVNSCERPCQSPGEINSSDNFLDLGDEFREDFDAESILDEEVEEGIDSIMGDIPQNNNESMEESKNGHFYTTQMMNMNTCYGYPVGMGHYSNFIDNYGHGLRRDAFRNANDHFNWCGFSSVNVTDISPQFNKTTSDKKKKKKVEKIVELKNLGKGNLSGLREAKGKNILVKKESKTEDEEEDNEEIIIPKPNVGLLLKLDYDVILNAWSDKSTPLPEELLNSEGSANDVQVRFLNY